MSLYEDLKRYQPINEQEARDLQEILRRMEQEEVFTRENNGAHLTASAWVVDESHQYALMCYHNLYQSWSWLGGHADGETDLLAVAMREVKEESGVIHVKPVSNDILSVEILTVDGHEKRGRYVSSHLHLNVTYLLEADMHDPVFAKPDENQDVRWFLMEDALHASNEEWFKQRIYPKLIAKVKKLANS